MTRLDRELPVIITADQVPTHDLRLGEARMLVNGDRSSGAYWMGVFRQDPGFVTPLHLHPKTDEILYVIDGVLSLYISDGWHDLDTGTLAFVPHGTRHAQCNAGRESARVLGSGNPAGFERFFSAQQELLARTSPEDPHFFMELAKLLREYDTEVLGPPPARTK